MGVPAEPCQYGPEEAIRISGSVTTTSIPVLNATTKADVDAELQADVYLRLTGQPLHFVGLDVANDLACEPDRTHAQIDHVDLPGFHYSQTRTGRMEKQHGTPMSDQPRSRASCNSCCSSRAILAGTLHWAVKMFLWKNVPG